MYGLSQLGSSSPALRGAYSHLPLSASIVQEQKFPQRPGQPDCKYYMRSGDCKYGPSCRYNHTESNCVLNPLRLPLRPVRFILPFIVIISLFYLIFLVVGTGFGIGLLVQLLILCSMIFCISRNKSCHFHVL